MSIPSRSSDLWRHVKGADVPMLKQGIELKQQQKLSPLQIQTSKLIELRVGYTKWIRRTEFAEPHLRSSVNMMHAVASYLRRDIEVVITRRS